MKLRLPYLLFVVVMLFSVLQSCKKKKSRKVAEPKKYISQIYEQAIEDLLENDQAHFPFQDTLNEFYAKRDFKPLWKEILLDKQAAKELFSFANNYIKQEGLFMDSFDLAGVLRYLPDTPFVYDDEFYEKLSKAELVISNTLLHLHHDSKIGYVKPKEVLASFYDLPTREHPDFDLFSVLDPEKYTETIQKGRITDTNYLHYQAIMDSLYGLMKLDTAYMVVDTSGIRKLEVGDSTTILPAIANNLVAMGIISEKAAKKASPVIYNKEFKRYIRKAQTAFGLHDDGIIGAKSLRMFNLSIHKKMEELKVNMERERWLARPEEPPFVLVNLPQYKLFLHYIDSMKSMDICIGKPRSPLYNAQMKKYQKTKRYWDRPRDFETPQIYSRMEYFVMNPTWRVPRSIVVREMYHQMRRDSYYLRKNHYKVFRKDVEVPNPDTINWRRYSATKVPYRFVQTWGEHNALGQVKYIFRNKHHIYFHDTPQKSRFKWTQRSVSHGCVRLSDPLLMGDFVLKEHKKYNYDDFRIFLGYEPLDEERLEEYDPKDSTAEIQPLDTTKLVHLDQKIPIYFLYRTVWYNEKGLAVFNADVYGKNEEIYHTIRQKMANLPSIN